MFSRIITSAKGLFAVDPNEEEAPQPSPFTRATRARTARDNAMVTTRRQAQGSQAESPAESIVVEEGTPATRKRQRTSRSAYKAVDLGVEDVAVTPKSGRKKKLPLRELQTPLQKSSSRLVVEIPVSKVVEGKSVENEDLGDGKDEEARAGSQEAPLELRDSDEDKADEVSTSIPKHTQTASRDTLDKATPKSTRKPAHTKNATEKPAADKSKHKRFGSVEPEPAEAEPIPAPTVITESDDDDSDDDAPEEINVQEAAQAVKSRVRDAAKAAEE